MKKIDQCESSAVLVGLLLAGILLVMGAYRLFSWLCTRGIADTVTYVLGAAALGDIGVHFPPQDERFLNANSLELLAKVGKLVQNAGYTVQNVDATVLAQRPKLQGATLKMRQNIAGALGLPVSAVSVKATTEEGLGFTGTGQGIAAHAVCLIE